MAYALGLPSSVARLIYDMRDWRLEEVKRGGGTPSCRALRSYSIDVDPGHPFYECEDGDVVTTVPSISWTSPFPNHAVYERATPSYEIERLVINLSEWH